MEQTTLDVTGMACDGCEQNVTDALEALEGISSVTANHEADQVRVEHDETAVDEETIATTIEDAGYEVSA
ncbi:heavy-metal-associated domain-containing protein [Halosolutus amylolyticus]|uniref:Heavy-metal-associated domain-containing protein n=1 Tax=Halosolutus amylolyticus TaxID=2932267 RepID=A0ABD5PNZ6_9EURY|nr:heavy-metal-associated domain-containing protein [Halosolutus amylolyticus]